MILVVILADVTATLWLRSGLHVQITLFNVQFYLQTSQYRTVERHLQHGTTTECACARQSVVISCSLLVACSGVVSFNVGVSDIITLI